VPETPCRQAQEAIKYIAVSIFEKAQPGQYRVTLPGHFWHNLPYFRRFCNNCRNWGHAAFFRNSTPGFDMGLADAKIKSFNAARPACADSYLPHLPPMTEIYLLTSLPLFPLGAVLFPGGHLPLRIFEVRYLDMIAKCHKVGAPFGVVALTEGSEVVKPAQTESFNSVGTLARIDELAAPQAGLLVIHCTGLQRFEIKERVRMKTGLWIASVTRLADDQSIAIPSDLKAVATALEGVIKTLQARGVPAGQMPLQPPYALDDCAWVANRWCELLPLPPAEKQRLMALDNPLLRLELVGDILAKAGISN
jgi:uncharacterized protein